MRKLLLVATAALVSVSLSPLAQAAPAGDNTHASVRPNRGVELSGKLSPDGKLLVTDDDNTWSVANAEVLKGLESRYVKVVCRMDPQRRTIKVLFVVEPAPGTYLNDAAFRR
jgi:hypothetical protein